jgi:hypothetical protein
MVVEKAEPTVVYKNIVFFSGMVKMVRLQPGRFFLQNSYGALRCGLRFSELAKSTHETG